MELVSVHEASLLSAGLLWLPCVVVAVGSHPPLEAQAAAAGVYIGGQIRFGHLQDQVA